MSGRVEKKPEESMDEKKSTSSHHDDGDKRSSRNSAKTKSTTTAAAGTSKPNSYVEHPRTRDRPAEEIKKFRKDNFITILGKGRAPNPILWFNESPLPAYFIEKILDFQSDLSTTPLPAQCMPIIMRGENLFAIVNTDRDKRLTYVLPAIGHIKSQPPLKPEEGPIVVVLTAKHKIVDEIVNFFEMFVRGKDSDGRRILVSPGRCCEKKKQDFQKGRQLAVATPDCLTDMIRAGHTNLNRCTYLVIDNMNAMLFLKQKRVLRNLFFKHIKPNCQVIMWCDLWTPILQSFLDEFFVSDIQVRFGEEYAIVEAQQMIATKRVHSSTRDKSPDKTKRKTIRSRSAAKSKRVSSPVAPPPPTISPKIVEASTSATTTVVDVIPIQPVVTEIAVVPTVDLTKPAKSPLPSHIHFPKNEKKGILGQEFDVCTEAEKLDMLQSYLLRQCETRKTIVIFADSCNKIFEIHAMLIKMNHFNIEAVNIHDCSSEDSKQSAVNKLNLHQVNVLVATQPAICGLKLRYFQLVINYEYPAKLATYKDRVRIAIEWIYSILTRNDALQTQQLIDMLEESHQYVNPKLKELARFAKLNLKLFIVDRKSARDQSHTKIEYDFGGLKVLVKQEILIVSSENRKAPLLFSKATNLTKFPLHKLVVIVDDIANFEWKLSVTACWIDVDLPKHLRHVALADFDSGKVQVLITTHVALRKLTLNNVSYIFMYDFPHDFNDYINAVKCAKKGSLAFFEKKDEVHSLILVSFLKKMKQKVDPLLLEKSNDSPDVKKALNLVKKPSDGGSKSSGQRAFNIHPAKNEKPQSTKVKGEIRIKLDVNNFPAKKIEKEIIPMPANTHVSEDIDGIAIDLEQPPENVEAISIAKEIPIQPITKIVKGKTLNQPEMDRNSGAKDGTTVLSSRFDKEVHKQPNLNISEDLDGSAIEFERTYSKETSREIPSKFDDRHIRPTMNVTANQTNKDTPSSVEVGREINATNIRDTRLDEPIPNLNDYKEVAGSHLNMEIHKSVEENRNIMLNNRNIRPSRFDRQIRIDLTTNISEDIIAEIDRPYRRPLPTIENINIHDREIYNQPKTVILQDLGADQPNMVRSHTAGDSTRIRPTIDDRNIRASRFDREIHIQPNTNISKHFEAVHPSRHHSVEVGREVHLSGPKFHKEIPIQPSSNDFEEITNKTYINRPRSMEDQSRIRPMSDARNIRDGRVDRAIHIPPNTNKYPDLGVDQLATDDVIDEQIRLLKRIERYSHMQERIVRPGGHKHIDHNLEFGRQNNSGRSSVPYGKDLVDDQPDMDCSEDDQMDIESNLESRTHHQRHTQRNMMQQVDRHGHGNRAESPRQNLDFDNHLGPIGAEVGRRETYSLEREPKDNFDREISIHRNKAFREDMQLNRNDMNERDRFRSPMRRNIEEREDRHSPFNERFGSSDVGIYGPDRLEDYNGSPNILNIDERLSEIANVVRRNRDADPYAVARERSTRSPSVPGHGIVKITLKNENFAHDERNISPSHMNFEPRHMHSSRERSLSPRNSNFVPGGRKVRGRGNGRGRGRGMPHRNQNFEPAHGSDKYLSDEESYADEHERHISPGNRNIRGRGRRGNPNFVPNRGFVRGRGRGRGRGKTISPRHPKFVYGANRRERDVSPRNCDISPRRNDFEDVQRAIEGNEGGHFRNLPSPERRSRSPRNIHRERSSSPFRGDIERRSRSFNNNRYLDNVERINRRSGSPPPTRHYMSRDERRGNDNDGRQYRIHEDENREFTNSPGGNHADRRNTDDSYRQRDRSHSREDRNHGHDVFNRLGNKIEFNREQSVEYRRDLIQTGPDDYIHHGRRQGQYVHPRNQREIELEGDRDVYRHDRSPENRQRSPNNRQRTPDNRQSSPDNRQRPGNRQRSHDRNSRDRSIDFYHGRQHRSRSPINQDVFDRLGSQEHEVRRERYDERRNSPSRRISEEGNNPVNHQDRNWNRPYTNRRDGSPIHNNRGNINRRRIFRGKRRPFGRIC